MRKLKIQTQTTVDGFMGAPNGEMDWLQFPWTDDLSAHINALTKSVDTIVLGRKLAEGFIPAWAAGPEHEEQESIDWMNNTPKVVVSNSLAESPWDNATVAGGDLATIITELKNQPGGDLIAYGGATLVSALIAEGLADDIHLFVNPTAIGTGLPVFPATTVPLELAAATPFECGITELHYVPRKP
ncbi:bifunctional deaminase-reductase domain protein [Kribbella flavida DSM 17836]|uniref:Bifunctional deaminase-reductase domain protein n=1 Tax=Kribbella flavida (strain DSM 17836 / JCM 10339 / NBRC 14399) TaxID=479435 RepID=D2PSB0_KRIFD|nr:dihydrofolate reductase family protein [Kribbella flavida]ADB31234.1 bifunctional deaminase-reductase domain protein [Kribbella flavida DSM 17836]